MKSVMACLLFLIVFGSGMLLIFFHPEEGAQFFDCYLLTDCTKGFECLEKHGQKGHIQNEDRIRHTWCYRQGL
jgi:hypothetical protein